MDRAGRFRMSRDGWYLCLDKTAVAVSSLRDDLGNNVHELLFEFGFHVQDTVGGGSEFCVDGKLKESFFLLLFQSSGFDNLGISYVVVEGWGTVTLQTLLRKMVALPFEMGEVGVGGGGRGVGEPVHF